MNVGSLIRYARRFIPCIGVAVVLSTALSYATAQNWLSPLYGELHDDAVHQAAISAAHESGVKEGLRKGSLVARQVVGLAERGIEDAREKGYEEGFDEGRLEGAEAGCLLVFELLDTTRVMDFEDYRRGVSYASYYSDDVCDGISP